MADEQGPRILTKEDLEAMRETELVEQKDLPTNYQPPEGVHIIRPFKELKEFWPNDQSHRLEMLAPFEQQHLIGFGTHVASIFGVDLINDLEYVSVPEEGKASCIFVVLTRAGVKQVSLSIYEWDPIVVAVKYTKFVAVHCQLDVSNNTLIFKHMLLWNNRAQEYAPVFDEEAGQIRDPRILLEILSRYAQYEGLAPKELPTPLIVTP